MQKRKIQPIITTFDTHQEADEANLKYYSSLSPEERLEIALELMQPIYEAYPRFERVYRTAQLGECPVSSDWRMGP